MTLLARARVDNKIDLDLTRGGATVVWPTVGRLSGGFGCTNVRFYPRRGSCAHFHDGIDIANVTGTPIRAMAAGVVAYVGWNPSDERGRAFIIVIAHPNGLVSRYGRMFPGRRVVAGQVVRKGQVIARMGSTGFSTGSHLHLELLSGGTPIDPRSYLRQLGYEPAAEGRQGEAEGQGSHSEEEESTAPSGRQGRKVARAAKAARSRRAEPATAAALCQVESPLANVAIGDISDLPYPARTLTATLGDSIGVAAQAFQAEVDDLAECRSEDADTSAASTAATSRDDAVVLQDATRDSAPIERQAVASGPTARIRSTSPTPQ